MDKKNNHINDELLVKHLLGEATGAEQTSVADWIAADSANEQHYLQLKQIWDKSKEVATYSNIDEEAAWGRFQQRVSNQEEKTTKTIPLKNISWMRVAALLVLLVGGGLMFNYWVSGSMVELYADNTVLTKTLPDGTTVTINKGSSLSYNSRFRGDTRNVSLKGEAFFDVTPNKNKPFIITTDNASIKVVGTSFNVKSSSEVTEVIVETGIVEVSKKANTVQLLPKQKATVLNSKSEPVKEEVLDVLYNYYRTKELVCNNTPLWRLVDVLNDVYGSNITIANTAAKDMAITTTFKNESLDYILNTISSTLNVQVEKNGNLIIIK